jgi:hypothetical protein
MNETASTAVATGNARGAAFIPVSRNDIIEALLAPEFWRGEEERAIAKDVFRRIGCLRQHRSAVTLNEMSEVYDPFNPDDETVNLYTLNRKTQVEQRRVFNNRLRTLVSSANYNELDDDAIEAVLDQCSPDGVHVDVDFSEYDLRLLFCRGESEIHRSKRDVRWAYLKRHYYTVSIYRRLIMAIKFKPDDIRVAELMSEHNITVEKARKLLRKLRITMPPGVSSDHIYIKVFKDIPQLDVEMLFPNIQVRMKYRDKVQLGGSAFMGFVSWLLSTVTKLLATVALSPIMLVTALITGFGGIMYAQIRNFFVTRDRYRMQLAQNLYFQNLANNQGALAMMVDEAEEEDVKEEALLYAHLLGDTFNVSQLDALREHINAFLKDKFAVEVNFDIHDALARLIDNRIVSQSADGVLRAKPLKEANEHLHRVWCTLDNS